MDTGLYTAGDVLITPYVNVIPKKDTVKVENRLLDGSFHVQVIGVGADLVSVTIQAATEEARARVDTMEATGEIGRIVVGSATWRGVIRETLNWEKTAGVFKATFELLVTQVGA